MNRMTLVGASVCCAFALTASEQIGREVAVQRHLQDGEEYSVTIPQLVAFGEKLFTAKWTIQEGQGRPNVRGTAAGPRLSVPSEPLVFPRNFNRISGPDANSCSGSWPASGALLIAPPSIGKSSAKNQSCGGGGGGGLTESPSLPP